KGRIQGIRTVGGCQNNNALSSVETVHLGQQLVQCLLALIISGESAAVTLLADGINLIDEDDTRRFLICLLKQVADLCRSHSDEHLNKLGTRNGEKRHIRFSCDRLCQQGFTGTRRSYQQGALWHFCSDF